VKPIKNWKSRKSILALAIAGAISPVLAEETASSLDTIVVSGSRSEELLLNTPNAISVIGQEEIDKVKFIDANKELLTRIPGNSMGRNLRWAFGSKNYTVNLRDGVMMRPFGKGFNRSLNEVNTWDIERVEVTKGPASALFGSQALGGVINIITKAPPPEREINVWTEAGSWERYRSGASIGDTQGNFGYKVDVNGLTVDGWRDRTKREEKAFTAKGVWTFSPETKLTLRAEHQDKRIQQPGSISEAQYRDNWRQADVYDAYEDTQFSTLSGIYEHQFNDKASIKVSYSARKTDTDGPTALSYKSGYVDDEYMDNNLVLESHWKFDPWASKLVVGADLQHSDVNETSKAWTSDVSTNPGAVEKEWDLLAEVVSPFTQVQFSPVDWAEVTLGARYDHVDYEGKDQFGTAGTLDAKFTEVSTKAGISFALNENNSLWFGYGEGFVAPSRSRLFTSTAAFRGGKWRGYNADPDLDPETAENYSIGLRGATPEGMFGYDMTLYYSEIEDMVVGADRGGADRVYVNAGEVEGKGLEAAFHYQPMDNLRFNIAYTYADHEYSDFVDGGTDYTGNILSSSPLHHINARVTFTPIALLDVELEMDSLSAYETSTANDDPTGRYRRPDLFHLKANYDTGVWSVWGQVRNLTDEKYGEGVSYGRTGRSYSPGEPRSVNVGVRYSFL